MSNESNDTNGRADNYTRIPFEFHRNYMHLLKPEETVVLLAFLEFADFKTYECFPSIDKIVERTGLNRRAINRAIKVLKTKGHLITVKRFYNNTIIRRVVLVPNKGLDSK